MGRCEPFDTYPRTYDLLHASGLFSKEQNRYVFYLINGNLEYVQFSPWTLVFV
jgi:hypothetical protein